MYIPQRYNSYSVSFHTHYHTHHHDHYHCKPHDNTEVVQSTEIHEQVFHPTSEAQELRQTHSTLPALKGLLELAVTEQIFDLDMLMIVSQLWNRC